MCLSCIAESKASYFLITTVVTNINKIKESMKEEVNYIIKNNIKTFNQIQQKLIQFQQDQEKEIEQIQSKISQINEEMKFRHIIEAVNYNNKPCLNNYLNEQLSSEIFVLIEQLRKINQNEELLNLLTAFIKAKKQLTIVQQQQQFEETSNDLSRTPFMQLVCETHQKEIIMIDLNSEKQVQQRIVHLLCLDDHNIRFNSIKYARKELENLVSKRQQRINQNIENLKNKGKKFFQTFEQIKSNQIEQINQMNKKLNVCLQEIISKAQLQYSKMNKNWDNLSASQLNDIADILSHLKSNENYLIVIYLYNQQDLQQNNENINKIIYQLLSKRLQSENLVKNQNKCFKNKLIRINLKQKNLFVQNQKIITMIQCLKSMISQLKQQLINQLATMIHNQMKNNFQLNPKNYQLWLYNPKRNLNQNNKNLTNVQVKNKIIKRILGNRFYKLNQFYHIVVFCLRKIYFN